MTAAAKTMAGRRALIGILWMLFCMAMFVSMDTIAKYLAGKYPVPFVVWGRYTAHAVIVALVLLPRLRPLLRTKRPAMQFLRSSLLTLATFLMVTALSRIPLADANAILLLAPIVVTALSMPLLGEPVGIRRWSGVAVGFIGAMIIIRPGAALFDPWSFFALGAACCFGLVQLATRSLAKDDGPLTTLIFTASVGALVSSAVVPGWWQWPETTDWLWIGFIGLLGAMGHFGLIKAMEHASAATVAPFTYTGLLWAIVLGYIVFGDFPDQWTFAGAALIVASGLYIWHRERVRNAQ